MGKNISKEEENLPIVWLVMSASITFAILPGAGAAKTKEVMTPVWHIHSTGAFYFTPW